jgi:hypothetical protein
MTEGQKGVTVTHRFVIRDTSSQKLADVVRGNVYFGVRKVDPLIDKSSLFGIAAEKP